MHIHACKSRPCSKIDPCAKMDVQQRVCYVCCALYFRSGVMWVKHFRIWLAPLELMFKRPRLLMFKRPNLNGSLRCPENVREKRVRSLLARIRLCIRVSHAKGNHRCWSCWSVEQERKRPHDFAPSPFPKHMFFLFLAYMCTSFPIYNDYAYSRCNIMCILSLSK